ncbi:MAG: hypothetical protein HC843_08980 [Sphingomonadales bacterium]|nr:hypothetical protein [Sphingomonadales bacterium]
MITRLTPVFLICLVMAGVHILNMLTGGSLAAFGVHPREISSIPAIMPRLGCTAMLCILSIT